MRKYPPPQMLVLLIVLIFCSMNLSAQTRSLTGVVKDSANQPLVAATVTVKGSKVSTTTAADGSFTLNNVPAGDVDLEITYVGFTPQTVPVLSTQTSIDVTLLAGSNTISDVVVTALGIKEVKEAWDIPPRALSPMSLR